MAKRKPYRPKLQGTMTFPMKFNGSDAEFYARSKYTGIFAHPLGRLYAYSQPRLYKIQLHFCIVKDEKYEVIDYQITEPLTQYQLSDLIIDLANKDVADGDYDLLNSYIFVRL